MMKNMMMFLCWAVLIAGCGEPITIQISNDTDGEGAEIVVAGNECHDGGRHDSYCCDPCDECGWVAVEEYTYYDDPWWDGYVYYDDVYVDDYYYDDGYYYDEGYYYDDGYYE